MIRLSFAIALTSAAALAYEILLIRLFAIVDWSAAATPGPKRPGSYR